MPDGGDDEGTLCHLHLLDGNARRKVTRAVHYFFAAMLFFRKI